MPLPSVYVDKLSRSLTRLGLGSLPMGPLQRGLTPVEGARVVRAALDHGITFIDTATVYGTYEHVAVGLEGWAGEVTVSTKTHARSDRALAEEHIEKALRELRREPIDIMLCHCGRSVYSDAEWGPTLAALLLARDKGLVRMVGLSSHSVEGVRVAASMPEIEVIHPLINLIGMGITDGTADQMLAAIDGAHAAGKLIYAMKALAGGNLVPRRGEALRFAFDNPSIDAVAVGMVKPEEVEWNVRFASGEEIDPGLEQRTAMSSKRLSIVGIICKGCAECVEHCENMALSVVEGKAVVDHDRCILCGYCAPYCPMLAIRMV